MSGLEELNEIREMKSVMKFSGPKKQLKQMRILLLEDEKAVDNMKMVQIVNQLKETDIEMVYSTYSDVLGTLQKNCYNFTGILIIASLPAIVTKKLVALVIKHLKDNDIKQIPFAIVSG